MLIEVQTILWSKETGHKDYGRQHNTQKTKYWATQTTCTKHQTACNIFMNSEPILFLSTNYLLFLSLLESGLK